VLTQEQKILDYWVTVPELTQEEFVTTKLIFLL